MSNPTIGFIGLGIMGRPMAKHLLNAGYPLVVYDIYAPSVADLKAAGAAAAASPKEVAAQCSLLITMLPDSPDVEAVALGPNGIAEGVKPGTLYADMSSIAPSTAVKVAKALAEKGVRCMDAPVSGGEVGAINAALSIMVGGVEADFEEFKPVFERLGKTITLCGPNGAGQTVKACNQIQVALNILGMAEAMVLGSKAGVDPAVIQKVLAGGYAQSRVSDVRGPKVVVGDFKPGFKGRFHFKDLNIIMKTSAEYGVSLPVTSVVYSLFSALLANGGGELDHTAVITVLEKLSGVEARTKLPPA
jgi:2-hydroxy-3-oxopropionate reductase